MSKWWNFQKCSRIVRRNDGMFKNCSSKLRNFQEQFVEMVEFSRFVRRDGGNFTVLSSKLRNVQEMFVEMVEFSMIFQ